MSDNTGSKMFFSFLTGAVIGAGLALLFAPQSGKETRKQIKDFSGKLSDEVKDGVEKLSEKTKGFIEGTKETFARKSRI
jgi:gas vesicle protein